MVLVLFCRCDDCCPKDANLGNTTLQAKLYSYIKHLDPLHIVAGAVQCSNLWMFSDVPAWPPAAPSASVAAATRTGSCVPQRGTQPALQLSLDLILTENYAETLEAHAGDGTMANGPSRDGAFRNGMARAALVNCRGLWTGTEAFADFPGSPRQTRTAMWLAAVTTEFFSELVFLLQSTGPWLSPNTLGGGWQQTVQVAIWATQMRALLPSFLRPFEATAHPTVNLTGVRRLLPTASTAGLPGVAQMPVRARAWDEGPCRDTDAPRPLHGTGPSASDICIHVILVNVLTDTPVEVTARVNSPDAAKLATEQGVRLNATRLFDASYNITVGFDGEDVILHDFIPAGEANIYEIGCLGPKPHGTSPWQACANRRVLCWDHNAQCGSARTSDILLKTDDVVKNAPRPSSSTRAISWWVSNLVSGCEDPAGPCPAADALLGWLHSNSDIVDTLILRCGIFTCCRTGCGECGASLNASRCGRPAGSCENNGGVGGTISGKISAACHRVLPKLHALGIRAELWLGNDDSLVSARHLLQHPNETATALIDLAQQNSFIAGFNIDLEAGGGTFSDALLHREFLEQVSGMLSRANGGLRLSTDVACSNFAGIVVRPLASNCSLLGSANLHGGRIMNMGTYNEGSYDEWVSALGHALQVPLHNLGVGLGVYTNRETAHTWNTNASSASDRICALMNHSVSEIDIFDLQPPAAPEDFWLAQLRKYKQGGGCDMRRPRQVVCPRGRVSGAWRPGGEGPDCCE